LKQVTWRCKRCGFCCRHLLEHRSFGTIGLLLFKDEKHLFPDQLIAPLFGSGIRRKKARRPRPAEIWAWQFTEAQCIHLDGKTSLCKIYRNRPLACKAFPLTAKHQISARCPQSDQLRPYLPLLIDFGVEIQNARSFLEMRLAKNLRRNEVAWIKPIGERWFRPTFRHWIAEMKLERELFGV